MRTKQRDTDEFEAFYKDVRGRLLLQTWALTGDLTAGRKAVQDALVIAWHHWRKVGRLERREREDWVRPIAWRRALRRHSVPHFHRAKDGDEEAQATLDALGRLPLEERKVLLLGHLSTITEDALAREVGLTQARAEQVLRSATRNFQLSRSMLPIEVLPCFESMAATVAGVRWPRPTILTRAGSARRRTHTVVGLGVAVAAFAGSGFAVTDSAGERPSLDSLSLHRDDSATGSGGGHYSLAATTLLGPEQLGSAFGGTWTTTLTSDGRDGTTTLPCQRTASADEHPRATLVRTFVGDKKSITSAQSTLASTSTKAARAAYDKTLGWYGGCRDDRMQLLDTRQVSGVGDQASVLLLRNWKAPQRTVAVGVARTGVLTTAVAGTVPVGKTDTPAEAGAVSLLGSAVQGLCRLPGAGSCSTQLSGKVDIKATTQPVPPPPTGAEPALVNEVDLPPVSGVAQPWVGTQPAPATTNVAATRCDQASFTGPGISHALTRSFVIPTDTHLAPQFGLTETIGSFGRQKAAAAFVGDIRDKLAACPKKDLGSHVTQLTTSTSAAQDITAWRVRVETSKTTSVVYLMAVVRHGSAVAQIGFVPSGDVTMDDTAFTDLATRAADRLTYLK
jgi:DNA-directed RNA polymerase specialized sigma24 family protein